MMSNPLSNPDTLNLNPDWPDVGNDESCTWERFTDGEYPQDGFWIAECKGEAWPISLLNEGAEFCTFCGSTLIVKGEG